MKVIDLLNKIANGQNIKNIKYQNHIYEYYNGDYREEIDGAYDSNWLFANEIIDLSNLNDEIEIIEENKDIEKLEIEKGSIKDNTFLAKYITNNRYKINELIDEVNKLKKELK